MFIIRIWNYFRGYAIIIVEGLKIERFINLAIINGIYIWDIKRQNYTTIRAKIGLNNFNKLRDIVRKTDSSISIVDKRGFPFVFRSIKKHKLLSLIALIMILFLYYISSHIWMIEIVGAKNIEKSEILQYLYREGLREGASKSSIDKRDLENSMLIRMNQLAWIGVQIKGTKALVEVVEKKEAPPIISKTDYCDIVAAKNGVINKLLVLNGDGLVKDGATVKKGQILVTGTIVREGMEPRYVHSMAQVTARTWYEDAEEIPLVQIEYKATGRSITRYKLDIMGKSFSAKENVKYQDYNSYEEVKNILCFGDFVFPVKLIKTRYEELMPVEKIVTVDEAKARCAERLNQKIRIQIPENAVILNKNIDYYVEDSCVKAKITVEVLEDIGVKQKISVN
ncbi:MAG: sporulation protein YqfD [Bacillota bacterium]